MLTHSAAGRFRLLASNSLSYFRMYLIRHDQTLKGPARGFDAQVNPLAQATQYMLQDWMVSRLPIRTRQSEIAARGKRRRPSQHRTYNGEGPASSDAISGERYRGGCPTPEHLKTL